MVSVSCAYSPVKRQQVSVYITRIDALNTVFHFFCYLNGDQRHLHSFPTRRSSDLLCGGAAPAWFVAGHPIAGTEKSGDRKSTRLNSSHANISYAVFCLKKKININNSTATTVLLTSLIMLSVNLLSSIMGHAFLMLS